MARKEFTLRNNEISISVDGSYRFRGKGTGVSAEWTAPLVSPAGTITLTLDGDPGLEPGSIDLGAVGQPGSRTCFANGTIFYVDVDVEGLPSGGAFTLYFG